MAQAKRGASKPKQNHRAANGESKARLASAGSAQMLDAVMAFMRRFVVLTDEQCLAVALWIVHTHLARECEQTPYLSVTSPEKQCGKSRVLETAEYLVARPWRVIKPSDAVAYRYIDAQMPTLLLDEVDNIFIDKQHAGMCAILNAGHRRGNKVPRSSDFGRGVEMFDCYCPKALAGIGTLPDTVADRSIYIRLERKDKEQEVERLIDRDIGPGANALRAQVASWAKQHGKAVARARPKMPRELSDRMEEGCESLVAIAERLGYGDQARAAFVHLLSGERLDSHETMRQRLLRDLRDIWRVEEEARGRIVRAFHTDTLLARLAAIEESPWGNYYGRRMEAADLAGLLKHYGVKSTTVKVRGKALKGYRRDDIRPVITKYVDD